MKIYIREHFYKDRSLTNSFQLKASSKKKTLIFSSERIVSPARETKMFSPTAQARDRQ